MTRGRYGRLAAQTGERQYLAMCALSVAGAYQLDISVPRWVHGVTGGRLGPNPIMLVFLLISLAGAVVAAAVPLLESTLLLYNSESRMEVRLREGRGHSREASDRPRAWVAVCEGRFAPPPPELRELRARRSHHALFLGVVCLACACAAARARGDTPA